MESTGIAIKKQSKISTNEERKFEKLGFEEIISKTALYLLVSFLLHVPASDSPDFAIQKL